MTPKEIAQLIVKESEGVKNLDPVSRIHHKFMDVSVELMKLMLEAKYREEEILRGRPPVPN